LRGEGDGLSFKSGSKPRLVFREDSGFADTDRSRERGDSDWSLGSARWSRLRSGIMASEDAGRRLFLSPLISTAPSLKI